MDKRIIILLFFLAFSQLLYAQTEDERDVVLIIRTSKSDLEQLKESEQSKTKRRLFTNNRKRYSIPIDIEEVLFLVGDHENWVSYIERPPVEADSVFILPILKNVFPVSMWLSQDDLMKNQEMLNRIKEESPYLLFEKRPGSLFQVIRIRGLFLEIKSTEISAELNNLLQNDYCINYHPKMKYCFLKTIISYKPLLQNSEYADSRESGYTK